MKLTVAEILRYPEFAGFKLIAGADGISNQIESCGILDYEYDQRLRNKYTKLSFIPNQMVLTSLQYAKDDPGSLIDAIRLLQRRKCSCLVIKNVYGLPIPAHALHLADSIKFPVILIKNADQYFENIIINIYKRLQSLYDFDKFENIISHILMNTEHDPRQKEWQMEINPCLQPDILCIYFRSENTISIEEYIKFEHVAKSAFLLTSYNSLLRYKKGFLYIHSSYNFKNAKAEDLAVEILDQLFHNHSNNYHIGVSSIHYKERKIKLCMQEAIYSSYFHLNQKKAYQTYETLGINSIFLPYCHEPTMQRFMTSTLTPLRDYDSENHTMLLETVTVFIRQGGNISQTATALNQHVNTIRYRLKQINHLLHCNILSPEGYTTISIALKIEASSHIEL